MDNRQRLRKIGQWLVDAKTWQIPVCLGMDGNIIIEPVEFSSMPGENFFAEIFTRTHAYGQGDQVRRLDYVSVFHTFILKYGLTLPATHSKASFDETWTWGRRGRQRKIDRFMLQGVTLYGIKEHRTCKTADMTKLSP